MGFLQAHGAVASVLVTTVTIACTAQWRAQHMANNIRLALVAQAPAEPLIALPVVWIKRFFVVWLLLNAWWLVGMVGLPYVHCVSTVALLALLGMLALIDAETGILPNELILVSMLLGWMHSWVIWGDAVPKPDLLWGMTLGYTLPMLFNFAYGLLMRRDAMGQGDAKLLAAMGLWLGARALADVWIIACVLMLVYTARLKPVTRGALHFKMSIPFGPFLVLAANTFFIFESV